MSGDSMRTCVAEASSVMWWMRTAILVYAGVIGVLGSSHCDAQGLASILRLKVADAATKQSLQEAEVMLVATGFIWRTPESGVVEIGGLRVGVTQIRIRRLGYRTQYLALDARSRLDTAVVWLEPVAANLPAIESRRSAIPGTYYRQLDVNGFYERMLSGARSRSAFVTDSAIERWKPQVISDLGRRIGRDLVRCSFLVDGVPVQPPLPEGRRRTVRSGIDALIQPTEVAGIEVYRTVEVPTQFAFATAGRPCLVVVWQK